MTIVEKSKVVEAYVRAARDGVSYDEACAVVSQALCIPAELVKVVLAEASVEES